MAGSASPRGRSSATDERLLPSVRSATEGNASHAAVSCSGKSSPSAPYTAPARLRPAAAGFAPLRDPPLTRHWLWPLWRTPQPWHRPGPICLVNHRHHGVRQPRHHDADRHGLSAAQASLRLAAPAILADSAATARSAFAVSLSERGNRSSRIRLTACRFRYAEPQQQLHGSSPAGLVSFLKHSSYPLCAAPCSKQFQLDAQ